MKCVLSWDEEYPVFGLEDPDSDHWVGMIVDVPEDLIERYELALENWLAVQQELDLLYDDRPSATITSNEYRKEKA